MSRKNIDLVEIESTSENGAANSTYVFNISQHMLDGEVCTGVALALSEVVERDPAQMTPLSSVVDCDALQLFFQTRRYGDLRDDVSVSFPYDVYEVTVHSSGRVLVRG
ncbi:HalOD1 output domain-containing protein [Halorussus pelagicus]|uniref:HalOD1 output domain-containing protein n=1 Tax=Halorussus pelagicus TaxID=2505977 RepID=UPI000FFC2C55|nr:HalOD1 output domain-containing protein [Halorussus pelagicus]